MAQHRSNVGIADRELLSDDATGEIVGSGAAARFRNRKRAQAKLGKFVQGTEEKGRLRRLQPIGVKRSRLELALDKIADRLADFALLGRKEKTIHLTAASSLAPDPCALDDGLPARKVALDEVFELLRAHGHDGDLHRLTSNQRRGSEVLGRRGAGGEIELHLRRGDRSLARRDGQVRVAVPVAAAPRRWRGLRFVA